MDLFKIEFFVEDKNLPKVKRAVAGMAIEFKDQPVTNVGKTSNGKLTQATSGHVVDQLVSWAKKHKVTDVDVSAIREFAKAVGRRPESASYILKQGQQAGMLKKLGKGTKSHYKVVLR